MRFLRIIFLSSVIIGIQAFAEGPQVDAIPESEMFPVQQSYHAVEGLGTNTLKRRAYKKVVRNSKALIKKYPEFDDRYKLLNIIFKCQQNLLMINNTAENRDDVFATARKLVEAPMQFSALRLQSDILLLRAKIAPREVTLEEKVEAVRDVALLYLESEAEANCLMYLTFIAKDLKDPGLFKELQVNLSTRFTKDPEVAAFLRERFGMSKRDMRFRGTFRSLKGKTISFPVDLIGYNYMVCFWSTKTPDLEKRFALINEYQEKSGGTFVVFSFNIDNLEDAGQSILTENELDWRVMHLPKGINSKAFLAYGHAKSLYTLLPINAMGYSLGKSSNAHTMHESDVDIYAILNGEHYLALMQALNTGHFLISESDSLSADNLKAIKECFLPIQDRYRMKERKILENYNRAIKLCDEFIASQPKSPVLWKIRNAKIIAHMGIWKVDLSVKHLNLALAEAKLALAIKDSPAAAKVIPQFCIAKAALRKEDSTSVAVITDFMEACGGEQSTSGAYAAGVVLSIDGGQDTRDLYRDYRYTILKKYADDKTILPVTSYLLKELYGKYLFQANEKRYYFGYTSIYAHERTENLRHVYINRNIKTDFITVSGKKISIPDDKEYHYHLCTFLDLPKNAQAELKQKELLNGLLATVGQCRRKDMKLVLFFLSQDTKAIKDLLVKYQLNCSAVSLPGGIDNPILTQLGIYSPENFANSSLIAPNGTFLVNYSKMHHKGTVIHRHDKDRNPWFDCMSAEHLSKAIKSVCYAYDTRMGDFYYHKAQGVQVSLFDKGSCCLTAYARGWTGCRKPCCRQAMDKGGVCLICNPGAKGKKPVPATPNDWKLAARYLGLTFNDNEKVVARNQHKCEISLLKAKDYKTALAYVNNLIKNHKKPHYGPYRPPIDYITQRINIYDLLGEKSKAAADLILLEKYKREDKIITDRQKQGKKNFAENNKKKLEEDIRKTKERLKKAKESAK